MMVCCADAGKWGVDLAYELARREVSQAEFHTLFTGGRPTSATAREVRLSFLNREHIITLPEADIQTENGQEVHRRVAVLLLHYLLRAHNLAPAGWDIEFRSLPGGMSYIGPYSQRTTRRLEREFVQDAQLLHEAGVALGAVPLNDTGDVAFAIEALPSVSIKVVFWKGDQEFPASATILYDASIKECLSTEDVVVLAETLVSELIRHARELRKERRSG